MFYIFSINNELEDEVLDAWFVYSKFPNHQWGPISGSMFEDFEN